MKILVLGSHGMAGHILVKYMKSKNFHVDTLAKKDATFNLDIENINDLNKINEIVENNYDFIINCIGLLIKDSNTAPRRSIFVNAWFPHYLEDLLRNKETRLIHLSTDCVFDGSQGPYVESDIHSEKNYYGKSKSLGEIDNLKDITFRMSIIGPELKLNGSGLMNWVLNSESDTLDGWENVWWNGITTLELAKCISRYIMNPKISGIYHLVSNENKINKYDLISLINKEYSLNKKIIRTNGPKSINKILVDTRTEFDFGIPDYQTMIRELREFNKI